MGSSSGTPMAIAAFFGCALLIQFSKLQISDAQQLYVDNKQLDCQDNDNRTFGYVCNGEAKSCQTYLTFRSTPTYNSPVSIAYLLGSDPSEIARINNISDVERIAPDTLVIVPTNCSCSGQYYQHNSSYILKDETENYYTVANLTYQGLTTCQSMIAHNRYNYLQLEANMRLNVPLRCACPTSSQTALGFKYLLSYLVTWGDYGEAIASLFNADNQSLFDANELSPDDLIYPFTPLLVPLKLEPTQINTSLISLPPPAPPMLAVRPPPRDQSNNSSRKWVFVGIGIGVGVLVIGTLFCLVLWFFRYRRGHDSQLGVGKDDGIHRVDHESIDVYKEPPETESKSWSEEIKYAVGTLTLYKYEELETATECFAEANRIKGSVFQGSFKGDFAAVKMMKGNVLDDINVLKQINHSCIIRLSGFCLHEGNTYLVYEYAENGSLSDLIHNQNKGTRNYNQLEHGYKFFPVLLNWKQRVQIAYDVADALNYLHNFANPPYVHKNLKSSNILLDGKMRAKVANFGLARTLGSDRQTESAGSLLLQMTRHVIGTHGYMAPEYINNGLVTPKLDVFALGVVMLELLSGRDAIRNRDDEGKTREELLSVTINQVLLGESIRQKLHDFIDPCLTQEYPLDLAYSMAQLAKQCVADDLNSRPTVAEVFMVLSKILSSSLDWDPSDELEHSR